MTSFITENIIANLYREIKKNRKNLRKCYENLRNTVIVIEKKKGEEVC